MTVSVALKEVAEVNPTTTTTALGGDDDVDFFPMAAVEAEKTVAQASERRPLSKVSKGFTSFQNGDVLLAKITPCFENGKIAQASVNTGVAFGSTEFHVLRCGPKVDSRYLVHYLRREEVKADGQRKMTGSAGQRRVPRHFLESLEIPLPAVAEQRRLAAILDKADALRTKRREALTQLDLLAQSIFAEMFGDPRTNQNAWPIVSVGSIADVQGGLQVTSARSSLPIEVPYLRVANVYRGFLNLEKIKTIRATANEAARTALIAQDMLIVEGHGNPDEVGRAALWGGEIARCVHQNHLIRARFDLSRVEPVFVCAYLNSPGGRQYLLRAGKTTSGLNTISVSNVRETPVALPPLPLQQAFVERLRRIETLKSTHCAALAGSESLFTSLQQRAFSGEL